MTISSRRRMRRRIMLFAALVMAVGGLCAASGSAATAPAPAPSRASGTGASVADTLTSAEPPISVGRYQKCADPAGWPGKPVKQPLATYLAGWSDVQKLNEATVLGTPDLALGKSAGTGEGRLLSAVVDAPDTLLCTFITMQLDYHGLRELPPVRATFLAYGFEPVTATVQLVQPGPRNFSACVEPDGSTSPACPPVTAVVVDQVSGPSAPGNTYQVVATAQLSLRISDVTVNGTPLNVGTSCQTGPVTTPGNEIGYNGAVLTGGDLTGDPEPQYANPLNGGTVDGSVSIPAVSDCGPGGNLDPLLTSAVSGPGNYVKLVQAPLCTTGGNAGTCEPDGTTPSLGPLWTIADGESYSGSGPAALALTGAYLAANPIKCADSTVSGNLPDSSGPPRGALGTLHLTFGNCVGPDGSTWTVTQQGTAYLDGVETDALTGSTGTDTLKITQISLVYHGWGGATGGTVQDPCQVVQTGNQVASYTNPVGSSPAILAPESTSKASTSLMNMISSTCANVRVTPTFGGQPMTASYPLTTGSGITITNLLPSSS